MSLVDRSEIDLMPPAFHEGLDDWSRGDGTPETPTYESAGHARLVAGDADFGACLEMRKIDAVQSLRYMGELPVTYGGYFEISARVKVLRGPVPMARIAAWPGGAHGRRVAGMPGGGPLFRLRGRGAICLVRAVIGPRAARGVDLAWDARVLYAHVGLELIGADGGVLRVEAIRLRDVSGEFPTRFGELPGFDTRFDTAGPIA